VDKKNKKPVPLSKLKSNKNQVLVPPLKTSQKSKAIRSSGISLGLRFKEDCWVAIKVDGRTDFHRVLRKGTHETWRAKEKIEFSLGNAGAVEVEINNSPGRTLGRRGEIIRNIIFTRDEGLIIKR